MARILTGIQSTGIPHLGNILGAIKPAIEQADQVGNDAFLFIADLHSLTTIKDASLRKEYVHGVAAAWLACGLDTAKHTFYRQSDVREVAEFTWYLSCFTPFPMLANAHSFKDKSDRLSDVNAGLFTYPVLMASDILMYDADVVPVGKDQVQHIEMARDIAGAINRQLGEILVLPEVSVQENTKLVPGTDGQKMSKSYGNFIDIFQPEKALRKTVMGIITDSTPMDEPKDPDTCTVFKLYNLLGTDPEIETMRGNYLGGNYGYGHAKQALFELILDQFADERARYNDLMGKPEMIEQELNRGAEKARKVAMEVIGRMREKLGY